MKLYMLYIIPSGHETWLAGKSSMNEALFIGTSITSPVSSQPCLMKPEGNPH